MVAEAQIGERPNRLLLRRRHVLEWTGCTRNEFYAWVSAGLLEPVRLKPDGEPYYRRGDVEKMLNR